jgi:hypothetical protein
MSSNGTAVQCSACGGLMAVQMDRLDLGWAGDGPYARDDDFAGILADVYGCKQCGRVAIRPVEIERPGRRASAA